MGKVSYNKCLGKLSFTQFKKYIGKHSPGEDIEKLYQELGGKLKKKKQNKGSE